MLKTAFGVFLGKTLQPDSIGSKLDAKKYNLLGFTTGIRSVAIKNSVQSFP